MNNSPSLYKNGVLQKMDNERIWLLLARKFSKEATAEELKELEALFKADPDLQYAYTLIGELKEPRDGSHSVSSEKEEQLMAEGLARIELSLKKSPQETKTMINPVYKRRKVWLIAASIAILIGMGWYLYMVSHSEIKDIPKNQALNAVSDTAQVYVAAKASLIELQDGTKVWLNRGSTLRCSNNFNLKNREVKLIGEAFFDVTKDADKPFIVHAGELMDVKVLGTSFNVKVYPIDPFVETSLVSGKVSVDIKNRAGQPVILTPNEKITVYRHETKLQRDDISEKNPAGLQYQVKEIKPNPVDQSISELSWMEDKLAFNDITFEELAYDLERVYQVKINFEDKDLTGYHLTGVFKNEKIDEVLHALQITTPFRYTISDNKVTIYH